MDAKIIPDSIRDVLDYDPETGHLTRKKFAGNQRAGTVVGHLHRDAGYVRLKHCNQTYPAHRVAWFLYHGEQPDVIDHINRDKTDNRIANLRNVSKRTNCLNRGINGLSWAISNRTATRKGQVYVNATYCGKSLYHGKNIFVALFRRIMAERQDHPIGLPAPDGGH